MLLHGSPGSHRDFRHLGPRLGGARLVLAPDLPGFGASSWEIPDYSIRAHARYVLDMLSSRGVQRAHFLGFSMGGGVALELSRIAPDTAARATSTIRTSVHCAPAYRCSTRRR